MIEGHQETDSASGQPAFQQKVTLTELRRYLPLPAPTAPHDLPSETVRFLGSPSFNNFSLKQQKQIQSNYDIAYRSQFSPETVVEHLTEVTKGKFTKDSLLQLARNCALKGELIDWYQMSRIALSQPKKQSPPLESDAVKMIAGHFRDFRRRQRIRRGMARVQDAKKILEGRLLDQYVYEAVDEVRQYVDRNRMQMEKIKAKMDLQMKVTYVDLEELVLQTMQVVISDKKVVYLYLNYDPKNVGKFQLSAFFSDIFREQKEVVVQMPDHYLTSPQELLSFVLSYTTQIYYTANDLIHDYTANYHLRVKAPNRVQTQLHPYQLYLFCKDKGQGRLSYLQASTIFKHLQFTPNLNYLFAPPNMSQLASSIAKIAEKVSRKKQLKSENEVYYEFRKIVWLLISRCRGEKLTRQQFTQKVVEFDPSLKYDAFYCVWRVYPAIINLKRMREEASLPTLACYLRLNWTPQQYEKAVDGLLEAFPPGVEVTYSRVEQKVNLHCDFVLDTTKIKPLPLGDYDSVIYQDCIKEILPPDIDIRVRSYIFRKVSGKFAAIWRGIKARKEVEKKKQMEKMALQTLARLNEQKAKEKLEAAKEQSDKNTRTRPGTRPKARNASCSPVKKREQVRLSETEQLVQSILLEVIKEVGRQSELIKGSLDGERVTMDEIVLSCPQKYTYRSCLTRCGWHPLVGTVGLGKQFTTFREGTQERLSIKIPYKPGLEVVDFVVWGDFLTVLTSYNTVEIYQLGQSNSYPVRTVHLKQSSPPQYVTIRLLEQICGQRSHGKYPVLMKQMGTSLVVNNILTNELVVIDKDTTVDIVEHALTFREHFYPNTILLIIDELKSCNENKQVAYIDAFHKTMKEMSAKPFGQEVSSLISETFSNLKTLTDNFQTYDMRVFYDWVIQYGVSKCRAILRSELGLRNKYPLPQQLKDIIKLLGEYMRERNMSLHEVIMDITNQKQSQITVKDFKNYLLRMAYELFVPYEQVIDRFLREVGADRQIDYGYLAEMIGYDWPKMVLEKPYFVLNDFEVVSQLGVIIYTLNGFNHIFVRQMASQRLVAVLAGHHSTPVFEWVGEAMAMVSADTSRPSKQHSVDMCVWRMQQDVMEMFEESPPWKVAPYYRLKNCHEKAVTCLEYMPRCNLLVSTSLDSTAKVWRVESDPFSLSEKKRVYSSQHFYVSASSYRVALGKGEVVTEHLLLSKVSKQVSSSNAYPYETTLEIAMAELVGVKVPPQMQYFQIPIRVREYMARQADAVANKKKGLLAKHSYQLIKEIEKGRLMLSSLDQNIYTALKNAFIFQQPRQLKLLSAYLATNPHAEMVVRSVCQRFGLDLLAEERPLPIESLEQPPDLGVNEIYLQSDIGMVQLPQETLDDLMERVRKHSQSSKIRRDVLMDIVSGYFYGDQMDKITRLIEEREQKSQSVNVECLQDILKGYEVTGRSEKFQQAITSLLRWLRDQKIPVWELFSPVRSQLDRSRKIRATEFTTRLTSMGFPVQKVTLLTDYLSKKGNINLYDFQHHATLAHQQRNPSLLTPNYSSIVLQQSQLLQNVQKQPVSSRRESPSLTHSQLQQEIQEMVAMKKSVLSQHSQEGSRSRGGSQEKRSVGAEDESSRGLATSLSRGSLSRDITQTRDSQKREAVRIARHLRELLRNEGKSMWQVIGLAVGQFIRQPILSQTEYFAIFDYIKTPFRLADKLALLKYMRRQAHGRVDLNTLFELIEQFQTQKSHPQGERFIVTHLVQRLESVSPIIQQGIELCFFSSKEECSPEELTLTASAEPFGLTQFALKEWEAMLMEEKKIRFTVEDIMDLLTSVIDRHRLKIEINPITFINQLAFRIENKAQTIEDIFPKQPRVDLDYFSRQAASLHRGTQQQVQNDFRSLVYAISKDRKKELGQVSVKYADFVRELEGRMGRMGERENKELEVCRKLVKQLESLKMSLFEFFLSIDRGKKFFVTQQQLQAGLTELSLDYDLWSSIPRRRAKRLTYFEWVCYLQSRGALHYKLVDTELEIAMDKFIKRFMRADDIERVFKRLAGENNHNNQVNFGQFEALLRNFTYFKAEETKIIFGLLVSEGVVRNARKGNDDVISDPANLQKTFSFKKFGDVVGQYRNENITKTAHYRFAHYLKQRNVSLTAEFAKWLDRNKKNKEVAEALKKDSLTLSRDVFELFVSEIGGGLSQKEIKELVGYRLQVEFKTFVSHLQSVYKKGSLNLQREEVKVYLEKLVRSVCGLDVTFERLYRDFAEGGRRAMNLGRFGDMCAFMEAGLNKIQLRRLFQWLDREKKGTISFNELMEAVEETQQEMEKDEEDYQFDYIIEKCMKNTSKYVLKTSKLAFTPQRACIIFESVLTESQTNQLYSQCVKEMALGSGKVTEGQMSEFLDRRMAEMRMRVDKKDKEMILRVLRRLRLLGIEVEDMFSYLSKHSSKSEMTKQEFVLLLQSLDLRSEVGEIGGLFEYLEEGRKGVVGRARWQDRLNIVRLEQEMGASNTQGQDLKLFYRVKLFLSEVYLLFVRKGFKNNQIYHFFDPHSTGILSFEELTRLFIQAGASLDENLAHKVTNYLDKQRENQIRVPVLVSELEQCLGSKMRLILQTKTSKLLKDKASLFQQKADSFIDELASRQEVIELNEAHKSCILQISFLGLLRQFGCGLQDDEVQDIRRNFQITEGYLQLYPIYTTFMNLFRDSPREDITSAERERYRQLMVGLMRSNSTIEDLSRLSNYQQLYNFIEQLGIFAPIDIKLIIQSVLYEGTKAVDIEQLKQRIRQTHLTPQNKLLTESFISFGKAQDELKSDLKSKIDGKAVLRTLGAAQGRITRDTFEATLVKMGIVLTKGTAKKYFQAFSEGQQLLDISCFMEKLGQNQAEQRTSSALRFLKSSESQMFPAVEQVEASYEDEPLLKNDSCVILSEHIVKSLNFTGTSLDEELGKYYKKNYGFVSYGEILELLGSMGVKGEQHESIVQDFMQDLSVRVYKSPLDKERLIRRGDLLASIKQHAMGYVQLNKSYQPKRFKVKNRQAETVLQQLKEKRGQIDEWLNQQEVYTYSLQAVYRFLSSKMEHSPIVCKMAVSLIPKYVKSFDELFDWIESIDATALSSLGQSKVIGKTKDHYWRRLMSKNPIGAYEDGVKGFVDVEMRVASSCTNVEKISALLLMEKILNQRSLLQIVPNLLSPPRNQCQLGLSVTRPDNNYPLKVMNSLTVDYQLPIDSTGLVAINRKYHAFPSKLKVEFDNLAILQHSLHPNSTTFYKNRNYYLWQTSPHPLPSMALSYRWKYIPSLAKALLSQLAQVHSLGYCVPHLRWNHLSQQRLIENVPYPCLVDSKGIIRQHLGWNSLRFEDSYCPPQFYQQAHQNRLDHRCDTWIFGCLLYQFVYGHPPASFLNQLGAFCKARGIGQSLAEVLGMEELPNQFEYVFFQGDKIAKALALQHMLSGNLRGSQDLNSVVKREQSLKGLLSSLQGAYGPDFKLYKEEFSLMEKINDLIYECLNINHEERPTIESLLLRPIFAQTSPLSQYTGILARQNSCLGYWELNIAFIRSQFELESHQRSLERVIQHTKGVLERLGVVLSGQSLPSQYTLPKGFRWPSRAKGPYSEQLLANKRRITQTSHYNLASLLYQGRAVDMLIAMALKSDDDAQEELLALVLKIVGKLIQSCRDYSSAHAIYASNILDWILKIAYRQATSMLADDWLVELQLPAQIEGRIIKDLSKSQKRDYLRVTDFDRGSCLQAIQLLSTITYENGQGNSEYLPLSDYLREDSSACSLVELVWVHHRLVKDRSVQMVDYLRDSLFEGERCRLQLRLKVEVDLMAMLAGPPQHKGHVLLYFNEAVSMHGAALMPIFRQLPLYGYLTALLRDSAHQLSHKQMTLQLIALLVQEGGYSIQLTSPATPVLREAVRMMVEPPKHRASYDEYLSLAAYLLPVARVISESGALSQAINSQAGSMIVESFLARAEEEGIGGYQNSSDV